MYLLGFDIGSSSVKVSLLNADTGVCEGSSFEPKNEMPISALNPGWAEQDPEMWWNNLKKALADTLKKSEVNPHKISAIGISYQMHGLVMADKNHNVIRPSIIWCDSRAATEGENAFQEIGKDRCLANLLNSPGNFTASKLKWVKDNEPELFEKVYKIMLPGDYIAMRLTGEIHTTIGGLSEGILWNFQKEELSTELLKYFRFPADIIPDIVPVFGKQGKIRKNVADELGIPHSVNVCYRAGDQPNNAFSLNVLNPGEVAATAGTSGVIYGVSDELKYDPQSRVNSFAHVNHTPGNRRLGVLLCINGTGILYAWLKRLLGGHISYDEMNKLSSAVAPGSEGLTVLPFGNGAERILNNRDTGSIITGLNFNIHNKSHLLRAAQEGVVFSIKYGMEIMKKMGITPSVIRAGRSNLFLSKVFRDTLASVTGNAIELYNTDGSIGAARGAGIGCGFYKSAKEAFTNLKRVEIVEPKSSAPEKFEYAYKNWKRVLTNLTEFH